MILITILIYFLLRCFHNENSQNYFQVNEELPKLDLPEQVDFDCSDKFDGSAHSHPDSCEFFFFCAGGRSFLQRCGSEAKFDKNEKRCVSKDYSLLQC